MNWNKGCLIPGASTRSWPSICIPPWAGGEAPFEATKPRITRAPAGLLPAKPVTEGGARRTVRGKAGWPGDLGHCNNLLGHHRIDVLDHGRQLVHHLRLRYYGSDVGNLLHGVSLYPLLRPRRLCQAGRPPPAGLLFVQAEEHRSLSVLCSSLSSSPALNFLCPREEWCNDVARAAAIDCGSCRHHERSRRCLRC